MSDSTAARRSPLYQPHVELGAKMADFGGWSMPIEYGGGGVLREHAAVRTAVGIFDVSHLGKAVVSGAGDGESAATFVNRCLTNDLSRLQPGQAQYTLCCDEVAGGTVDDLIAYLVSDAEVFLVPNAANTDEVVRRLAAAAPPGITVQNRHDRYGVLAVQGPLAELTLDRVGLLPAQDLGYMAFQDGEFDGRPLRICRTGYTGEHGYELVVAWTDTEAVWDALCRVADDLGGRPAGLGARDTLRTEMGYPLHGQDLTMDISAVQARAGWAVGWGKDEFWGRRALSAEKAAGPVRLLWGVDVTGRGIARAGMTVLDPTGAVVGRMTTGTFSPTLKRGIGLALIDTASGLGPSDAVLLDVRGRQTPAVLVRPPFVASHVRQSAG